MTGQRYRKLVTFPQEYFEITDLLNYVPEVYRENENQLKIKLRLGGWEGREILEIEKLSPMSTKQTENHKN